MSLKPIRDEIDAIDNELIELFKKRMDCSKRVAQYKMENGMEIFNPEREKAVLANIEQKAGEYGGSARLLYATIMELSRAMQHDMLGSGAELKNRIRNASDSMPFDSKDVRVACFGVPGTYAHKAAMKVFPNCKPEFYSPFREVFGAILNGQADFGVVPIENSSAGSVTAVYDLMLKYRFHIDAAADIPVDHCLAAPKGALLENIRTVYSHEQALSQCSDFINSRDNITAKEHISTAQAAQFVAETNDPAVAAICSRDAAEKYGLEVILTGFQNNPNNTTRFIVFSKDMYIEPDADKISLCFSLPHVTGSLYNVLCRFAAHGLNLTKIESRPIYGKSFEYMFYLDFTGSTKNQSTISLLSALSDELTEFSFLGNYKEIGNQ